MTKRHDKNLTGRVRAAASTVTCAPPANARATQGRWDLPQEFNGVWMSRQGWRQDANGAAIAIADTVASTRYRLSSLSERGINPVSSHTCAASSYAALWAGSRSSQAVRAAIASASSGRSCARSTQSTAARQTGSFRRESVTEIGRLGRLLFYFNIDIVTRAGIVYPGGGAGKVDRGRVTPCARPPRNAPWRRGS